MPPSSAPLATRPLAPQRRRVRLERIRTALRRAVASGPALPRLAKLSATLVLVLGLAGCATGNADEARIAATRDATQPAIVPEAQATNIVREFFKPTATPMPTATPLPTLATLTLATSLGANNQPANEVGSARIGGTIYAVAELHDLRAGETATAVFADSNGNEVHRVSVPIDRPLDAAWVPFRWDIGGVAPGRYAVYVYVDDVMLNSLVFSVG